MPVKRVAFHAGAHATCEVLKHVLIFMLDAAADRHHIANTAVIGILRREDMIEQCPFMEFRVSNIRIDGKESAGHLKHVVDVASFVGAPVHHFVQLIGRAEVFVFAMSSGGERMMVGHRGPEESGGIAVSRVAGVHVSG